MGYYLTNQNIGKFLGSLSRMKESDRIRMKERMGSFRTYAKANEQMALLLAIPEEVDDAKMSEAEREMVYQNLFFVATVYCRKGVYEHVEKPIRVENLISQILYTNYGNSEDKMNLILESTTGQRGTLYKALADVIRKSDEDIDCFSLMKDLQYWNASDARIQKKWATAFSRCRVKENEAVEQ